MKKTIIYIDCKNQQEAKKFFPIKILIKNSDVKISNSPKKSDLIIEFISRENKNKFIPNKKYLMIAGDNLFFKKNFLSFIESFLNKFGFKEKKYKIIDKLDCIIPKNISNIPLASFFPNQDKIISKTLNGKEEGVFFVTTNSIYHKNFISIPLFIQDYFYDLKKLLKKKIPSDEELKNKKFCAFVVSSNSSRERVEFFRKISKYKKVDSYGKVMNNMGDVAGKDWKNNSKLFENYKFVICFENSFSEDYITEKLLNAMFANSIPIYRGAKNVGEYFNAKSFVNYDNYGSYDNMIEKIIELDKDDKKYIEFLKQPWFKDNKVPKIFKDKERELINFYKKVFKE